MIYIFYDIYPKINAQVHLGPGLSGTSWKTSLCSCKVPFFSFLGTRGGGYVYHIEISGNVTHSVLIFETTTPAIQLCSDWLV